MYYSRSLIVTRKNVGAEIESISHALSLKAGLVHQLGSGLYDFLPLGLKILKNIECMVREEMEHIGALEVSFPVVQPLELWKESGRYDTYGDEMLRFKNREGREMCFGPTHEEVVSQCVRDLLDSYKQLPFTLYQVGRKYRDEKRPRHGLIRCREFVMKDAYSFDKDEQGMIESYNKFRIAYKNIFSRMGLRFVSVEANPGEIGGSGSEEFLAYSDSGEDKFFIDNNGKAVKFEEGIADNEHVHKGIEIGHIFQLGQTYSKKMHVTFSDEMGKQECPYMGCYGIGISRLIPTLIEQHHDEYGINWPNAIAPYQIIVIPIQNSPKIYEAAGKIHEELQKNNFQVLFDDRDCTAGVKFKDANLIGIPLKIIVGPSGLEKGIIEIEIRKSQEKIFCRQDEIMKTCIDLLKSSKVLTDGCLG